MSGADEPALRVGIVEAGPVAAHGVHGARRGRVAAVFERSAYLEIEWAPAAASPREVAAQERSILVCVGGQALKSGPLNALIASPGAARTWLASVSQGERVAAAGGRVRVGRTELDFRAARPWQPVRAALPVDAARLAAGVAQLRSEAAARIPDEGLGFLVLGAQRNGPRMRVPGRGGVGADALTAAGCAGARALHAWVAHGAAVDRRSVPHVLGDLVGLGPGLTPSGDDFIGGALVALHVLGHDAAARALAAWIVPLANRATHPVSAAHVRAAAAGLGSDALHRCLAALAEGRACMDSLDALAGTGHTSGWDALAGAVSVAAALGASPKG